MNYTLRVITIFSFIFHFSAIFDQIFNIMIYIQNISYTTQNIHIFSAWDCNHEEVLIFTSTSHKNFIIKHPSRNSQWYTRNDAYIRYLKFYYTAIWELLFLARAFLQILTPGPLTSLISLHHITEPFSLHNEWVNIIIW